jgi:tRNA(Ile)-lysidine synthase
MAGSATPRNAEPTGRRPCIAVAYSGGRDSTALLHATLAEATPLGVAVLALHVHHGLSPNADAWLAHCEDQCRRWSRRHPNLQLGSRRLTSRPAQGESVEAWARQARYRALREMALGQQVDVVLLAHHRRDQAETLLLQALRGAGVAGLSGMPRRVLRDGIEWQRPWLQQPGEVIDAYVRRYRLKHIDDESNADTRFARNRLRHDVWPGLSRAFPHAEAALSTAADWAQEASAALKELARIDLVRVAVEAPWGTPIGLALGPWLELSVPRRSNVLRVWLKATLGAPAAASLVTRLMAELPAVRSARWPAADGELQLHKTVLRYRANQAQPAPRVAREATLSVRRAGICALPGWGGRLQVTRVTEDGVPLAWLAHLDLKPREGAEQFQAGMARPPRSLKKQFQSIGVPAWDRDGPLVYSGGQLVFVPSLGLDARVIGLPGQALVSLRWIADAHPQGPGCSQPVPPRAIKKSGEATFSGEPAR